MQATAPQVSAPVEHCLWQYITSQITFQQAAWLTFCDQSAQGRAHAATAAAAPSRCSMRPAAAACAQRPGARAAWQTQRLGEGAVPVAQTLFTMRQLSARRLVSGHQAGLCSSWGNTLLVQRILLAKHSHAGVIDALPAMGGGQLYTPGCSPESSPVSLATQCNLTGTQLLQCSVCSGGTDRGGACMGDSPPPRRRVRLHTPRCGRSSLMHRTADP